ncbi:hypothetical protein ACFYKX_25210 [Cytobacillus sp. FJAT-54145]|uniref:Uncharacterized protein n=1 Tax=Cytobacillus spartinae TaxID=3299023 RepID=A0ABW6KM11_9BACI
MFSFSGFVKSLGIVLLVLITISFTVGLLNINHIGVLLTIMYSFTYVLNGVLAPLLNQRTPYFASYLSSITLTVLNLIVAIYLLDVMVLADPAEINRGLFMNSTISLLATFIVVMILKRKQRNSHA